VSVPRLGAGGRMGRRRDRHARGCARAGSVRHMARCVVDEKVGAVDDKPSMDEVVRKGFQEIFGNGEYRLKWGVMRERISDEEKARMDADVNNPERVAMREEAACSLTNIGAEERSRRCKVGVVGGMATLALALLVRDAPLFERVIVLYPFVALSMGFAVSAATGL